MEKIGRIRVILIERGTMHIGSITYGRYRYPGQFLLFQKV